MQPVVLQGEAAGEQGGGEEDLGEESEACVLLGVRVLNFFDLIFLDFLWLLLFFFSHLVQTSAL